MEKTIRFAFGWSLLFLAAFFYVSLPARATITQLYYWRMGENDSSDTPGLAASSTKDPIGGRLLTFPSEPAYATVTGSTATAATGSASGLNFSSAGQYGIASLLLTSSNTPLTNNFGIELWVKIGATNGNYQCLAYNGNTGQNGWGLYVLGGNWGGLFGDVTFITTTSQLQLNTWTHLALVRNAGTTTIYVNGTSVTTTSLAPLVPATNFGVAAAPPSTGNTDPLQSGYLDEVRVFAFASNAFTTSDLLLNAGPPVVSSSAATSVTAVAATLNGSITPHALNSGGYFQYGTTTNYGSLTPTTLYSASTSASSLTDLVNGLTGATLYHFRAVGTNSAGTVTGADQVFVTTGPGQPYVTTNSTSGLTTNSVTLQAETYPDGADTQVYFKYGLDTNYSFYTATNDAGSGSSGVSVTATASLLFPGCVYHFAAVASNSYGTVVSSDQTFTVPGVASSITVTSTSDNGAANTLRGAINNISAGGTITISATGTITLTNSLPAVFKGLTITGPGAGSLTISGASQYRIFFIDAGSNTSVNINNLTLANGLAQGGQGGNGQGGGGGGLGAGGALFVNSGAVNLSGVNFSNNRAQGGAGGGYGPGAGGGGGLGGNGGDVFTDGAGGGGGFVGAGGSGNTLGYGTGYDGAGGGGGFIAAGGNASTEEAGGGGGALTAGQSPSGYTGGTGGFGGGGNGANQTNNTPVDGGNGSTFGGGGGGSDDQSLRNGGVTGSSGGHGGKFGGGGGSEDDGTGGTGGDFGGGGGADAFENYGFGTEAFGGNGGFGGGGGGSVYQQGGIGGFGGGGGGSQQVEYVSGSMAFGGSGGLGYWQENNTSGGGGGAALGGSVFVRALNGASLVITGTTLDAGSVVAGVIQNGGSYPNPSAQSGQALGSSLFFLGGTNVISVPSGATNTIAGSIADSSSAGFPATPLQLSGGGTLVLSGANTYTGATSVEAGTLLVNGPASSSNFFVAGNATLGGSGTVGSVTLADLATLDPGTNAFTLTNLVTGGTCHYNWLLWNATNSPGLGYGVINVNGSLNLSSAAFVFYVNSLSSLSPQTSGHPAAFPTLSGGSWNVLQTTGGISGFSPGNWTIKTAGFSSSLSTVTFALAVSGNNLVLTPTTQPFLLALSVSNITAAGALLSAQANPYNLSSSVYFAYGTTTSYGTTNSVGIGSGFSPMLATSQLSGLSAGTVYHYRISASNTDGVMNSGDLTFTSGAVAPVVTTLAATSITATTATLNGTVNPAGAATGWYMDYGQTASYGSSNPTNLLATGGTPVNVNINVTGLSPATTYHFNVGATNSVGTSTGTDTTLTTSAGVPAVVVLSPTGINNTNATLNAQVTPNGAATTVYIAYGTTASYGTTNSVAIGSGDAAVPVSDLLSNLSFYTTYHYLVLGSNSAGTTSSGDKTFQTAPGVPLVTTVGASNITSSNATLYATVNPDGGASGYFFIYGLTSNYGSFTPTNLLAAGTSPVSVHSAISGLALGTTYHFLAVATNITGTNSGADSTFTTLAVAPTIAALPAQAYTVSNATLLATVNANGAATTVYFAYGTTTNYGLTNSSQAGSGISPVSVGSLVSNLSTYTLYHYRMTASNSMGTASTGDLTFSTSTTNPLTILNWWHMGELDPGATPGLAATNTTDSAGSDNLLINGAGAIYSTNVSPAAVEGANSDLSIDFSAASTYASGPMPTTVNNYFGIEGWFYPSSADSGYGTFFYNGDVGSGGWGLGESGNNYEIYYGGIIFYVDPATYPLDTWVHLALVEDNGVATLYTNGVAAFSINATPNPPNDSFAIGSFPGGDSWSFFCGLIDEVRIFTFLPGTFSTNYLLVNANPPPSLANVLATNLTTSSASLSADVTPNVPNGAAATVYFLWGLTTNYSATNTMPIGGGNAPVTVTDPLSGLTAYTTYHYEVIASNASGAVSSGDQTFSSTPPPLALTGVVTDLTAYSVSLTGTVNPQGLPCQWYFEYGLTSAYGSSTPVNPLASGNSVVPVTTALSSLTPATTYHYNLVATNSGSGSTGGDQTFTTSAIAPAVTLEDVKNFANSSATLNAQVDPNGAATTVYFSWGLDTNYAETDILAVDSGLAFVPVSDLLTNLAANTIYHYQILASNSAGTTSSGDQTFTNLADLPGVLTIGASNITASSAVLCGAVNPENADTGWYFQYGSTTDYGSSTTTTLLGAGLTTIAVSNVIPALLPGGTYHFAITATNSEGTSLGQDEQFSVPALPPTLSAEGVSITNTADATLSALVNPNGAATTIIFSWGLDAHYGSSNTLNVPAGNSAQQLQDALTNLARYTLYHYQITASNSAGITNTGDLTFVSVLNQAQILDDWHFGEADPGATAGARPTATVDSAGSDNLTMHSTGVFYSTNVSAAAAAAAGSSLSIYFSNGIAYASGPTPTTVNNNFCVEGWFYPRSGVTSAVLFYNGNAGTGGWGLGENGNQYEILYGGVIFQTTTAIIVPNTWTHLALVENGGTATLYTNGVAAYSVGATPNPPNSSFAIGANVGGGNTFAGYIDEVRIFSFSPGGFSTNELFQYPVVALISNLAAINLTPNGATLTVSASPNIPNGGSAQVWFEYGLTTNYGNVTSTNTLSAGNNQSVSNIVTGLQPGTTYHYRADLTGTAVAGIIGADGTFTTAFLPPAIGNAFVTAPGSFLLQFNGVSNVNYSILTSTDVSSPLSNWSILGVPSNVNNLYQFTDTNATHGQQFYILKQQ